MERLMLTVEATTTGTATVELTNNSNKPIRVLRDSNTWGAAKWRLLRVKDGRTEAFAQTLKDRYFTRNIPAFAIYDVPSTPESEKLGVWHGIVSGLTNVR